MISYKYVERLRIEGPALSLEQFAERISALPYREPRTLEKSSGGFLESFQPAIHHGMGYVLSIYKTSVRVAPNELVERHLDKHLQTICDRPITPDLRKSYRHELQQKLDFEVLPKEYESVVIYLSDINEIWIATKNKEALGASYASLGFCLNNENIYLKKASLTLGQVYLRDIFMNRHTPAYNMLRNPKLEINKRIVKTDSGMNDEMFDSIIGNHGTVFSVVSATDSEKTITLSLNGKGGIDKVECNTEFKHSWMLQGDPESHEILQSICAGIWVSSLKTLLDTIEKDTLAYFEFPDDQEATTDVFNAFVMPKNHL